jgi:hypothetical protein
MHICTYFCVCICPWEQHALLVGTACNVDGNTMHLVWEYNRCIVGTPCTSCGNRICCLGTVYTLHGNTLHLVWEQNRCILGTPCTSCGNRICCLGTANTLPGNDLQLVWEHNVTLGNINHCSWECLTPYVGTESAVWEQHAIMLAMPYTSRGNSACLKQATGSSVCLKQASVQHSNHCSWARLRLGMATE